SVRPTREDVRYVRALRDDAGLRAADGVFIAEGLHLARAALDSGAAVASVWLSAPIDATDEGRALRAALVASRAPVYELAPAKLDALQDARSPQPVFVVVRRRAVALDDVLGASGKAALVVVACGIQDPGNLGTI